VSVKHRALPGAVPAIRAAVSRFLEPRSFDTSFRFDVLLAVTEACTNVVRHAYPTQQGDVQCDAEINGSQLILRVTDWGQTWATPSADPGMGLGVPLMEGLTQNVLRSASGGSKILELRFRIIDSSPAETVSA
jgi:serine/threonine-protein kinase RsbW